MVDHITIQSNTPRIRYVADGALTSFEYPFAIFKNEDLKVYFNDTLQTSGYTVSGANSSNGGSVTFTTAPTANTIITLTRTLAIERTSDFQEGGALRANVLNNELDYQVACLQEVADNLNRSMVLPPYAVGTDVNLTLPTPAAGKAIVWNSAGTNLENSTVAVNELENTLLGYKTAAETAKTAAESASATATTQATTATTKATEAAASATTATEQATLATTTLASKANKDMDNLTATAKEVVVALGMPDYSAAISLPDSSFTVAYNGYICINTYGTNPGFSITINGVSFCNIGLAGSGHAISNMIPVNKNDSVTYSTSGSVNWKYFIPCKGEA